MAEIMDSKEYAKITAKNLKRILYEHDKTQADVCRDLGINKGTMSSWLTGNRSPRMHHIDMLCDYFHVTRADIMEPDPPQTQKYNLTSSEVVLLEYYRRLNAIGKERALTAVDDLTQVEKYKEGRN